MSTADHEEMLQCHSKLAYAVEYAQSRKERYDALQALYRGIWPFLKTVPRHQWAIDPQAVMWGRHFTPIEDALWCEIRYHGAVLYPQHPVGNYFVDFGHPLARVAVECDGKEWHKNKAKDAERQRAIEAYGWTVYRLSGADCLRLGSMEYDEDGGEINVDSPVTRLLKRLCREHKLSALYLADQPEQEEEAA